MVYLKSTKNNTAEVYSEGKWNIVPKFVVLNKLVRMSVSKILEEYDECLRARREYDHVLSGDLSPNETFKKKVLDIMGDSHSQPYHGMRQRVWSLLQDIGKRPRHAGASRTTPLATSCKRMSSTSCDEHVIKDDTTSVTANRLAASV